MSLLAATCALVDDIVDSGSFLRTQVSACDFGLLDTAPGACCVTVSPGNSSFSRVGFGRVNEITWGQIVHGWVSWQGDVVELKSNIIHIQDALSAAVEGGSRANCASLITRVIGISHDPFAGFQSLGGRDFALVTVNVTQREDP